MTPEQYCGVDPSRAMLRRARERFPFLDFQEGDVFKSLPASSFDCVVSCSLLVHLQDQETAIRNMWNHARRVLIGNFVVSEVVIESHIGTDGELIRHVPRTYISDILCSLGGADYIEWHRLGDATYFFRVWRKCV
jgi:ubiquinone/menaquinone biosynthesis C-methylase UbiE